ncbi:MAG: DEAD/DEAH box helicase [Bacteroidia bacterium]|nr:DEAD/DEAH box helicase [Bacteroidia bacterium]
MNFDQLGLVEPILKALHEEGYTTPTPIQQQAIPVALQGRDLLGCAQTGTGKTAAFAIPILQHFYNNRSERKAIRALILTPTRELAIQIEDSFKAYGRHTRQKSLVIFGGVPQGSQVNGLRNGTDILIATPGRLLDLMNQGFIKLDQLEVFVLDEADRMLDMGFINDVKKVIARIPAKRQTLFFSATMPPEIAALANGILKDPVKVEVTPVSSTAETITQSVYHVSKSDKKWLMVKLLQEDNIARVLVFSRTKHGADRIVKELAKFKFGAAAIHGNKSQNARQRALNDFKAHKLQVLVATDIAARGIDVDDLTHVINYDLPDVPETYVHRIGRTGRAGASGIAIAFCEEEDRINLRDIEKLTGIKIPVVEDHAFALPDYHIIPKAQPKEQKGRGGGRQQRGGNRNTASARPRSGGTPATPKPQAQAPQGSVAGTSVWKKNKNKKRRNKNKTAQPGV